MLQVGAIEQVKGDVTTLRWAGPRPRASIEEGLGFQSGRLAAGYWVLLLKEPLGPDDFEFAGTTLRSGGKLGLPGATQAAEDDRKRVHDEIMKERGADGYRQLQNQTLRSAAISGPERIAKVIPVTRHDQALSASEQYPMGGGGLQWTLVRKRGFLIAMYVAPDGMATTPKFAVSLAEPQPFQQLLDNRTRIARYLETA